MGLPYAIGRFLLLSSTVGVVCYACQSTSQTAGRTALIEPVTNSLSAEVEAGANSTGADSTGANSTGADPTRAESTAESEATAQKAAAIAAQAAAYEEGLSLASSAAKLSSAAVSPDDWGLVASRWQRAADQLKRISADSEHYAGTQSKINEYEQKAQAASDQIASLQASASAPLPARPTVTRSSQASPAQPSNAPAPQSPANPASSASAPAPVQTHQTQARAASPRSVASDIAAASAARRAASSTPASAETMRVPVVRRLHGTPVVRVTFNDAKTYDMILDTGASRTLITRQMANELNVTVTDSMIAATASAAQVTFDLGQMRSISVGGVRLSNAQVSIGDSVDIGLLGNDFLRGYDVTIRHREVELSRAR